MTSTGQQALAASGIHATSVHGGLVRITRTNSSPLYYPEWLIDIALTTKDPRRYLREHVEGGEKLFP